jgi:hypothetical protein
MKILLALLSLSLLSAAAAAAPPGLLKPCRL